MHDTRITMEDTRVTLFALLLLVVAVAGYTAVLLLSPPLAVTLIVLASWANLAILLFLAR